MPPRPKVTNPKVQKGGCVEAALNLHSSYEENFPPLGSSSPAFSWYDYAAGSRKKDQPRRRQQSSQLVSKSAPPGRKDTVAVNSIGALRTVEVSGSATQEFPVTRTFVARQRLQKKNTSKQTDLGSNGQEELPLELELRPSINPWLPMGSLFPWQEEQQQQQQQASTEKTTINETKNTKPKESIGRLGEQKTPSDPKETCHSGNRPPRQQRRQQRRRRKRGKTRGKGRSRHGQQCQHRSSQLESSGSSQSKQLEEGGLDSSGDSLGAHLQVQAALVSSSSSSIRTSDCGSDNDRGRSSVRFRHCGRGNRDNDTYNSSSPQRTQRSRRYAEI